MQMENKRKFPYVSGVLIGKPPISQSITEAGDNFFGKNVAIAKSNFFISVLALPSARRISLPINFWANSFRIKIDGSSGIFVGIF